jgi:RimJ/RimL family protein N-acetyltransferase
VIVYPQNYIMHKELAAFLEKYAFVKDSSDAKLIGWIDADTRKILGVVGFNGFIGKVCQMHVAMLPGYGFTPRVMLEAVFRHAFETFGREMLIGIVNADNKRAMKYDQHIGFKESMRLPGMHDNGGDLVIMVMDKQDCRYLRREERMAA